MPKRNSEKTGRERKLTMLQKLNDMYRDMGISDAVLRVGMHLEEELEERFQGFDANAEYNQLKVVHAMQKNKVSAECFNYADGYGYNDPGRDLLEKVYADTFHTEAALVRPQITCGTHALALALSANLRPGDELLSPVGKPYDTLEEVDRNPSIQRISRRIWNHIPAGRAFKGRLFRLSGN